MAQLSRPPIPEPVRGESLASLLRDVFLAADAISSSRVFAAFPDLRPAFVPIGVNLDDEGTRVTELARRTGLSKPSVVYLVDELERLGYVERVPDPLDGRAKLVRPTDRARAALAAGRRHMADIEEEWTRFLGEADMARLRDALVRLRAALWPPEASGAPDGGSGAGRASRAPATGR